MRIALTLATMLMVAATASCTTAGKPALEGMSFTDEPLSGKVIWNDLITEDIDAARRFYGGLFGWSFREIERPGGGEYSLARLGDVYVAGLLAADRREDGQNVSRWLPYVSVADVDEAVRRGVSEGASVAASARDVALGRVAAIIDPQGAVIGLANSRIGDPDDATTRAAPGRVVWHEMLASETSGAAGFYRVIAGLEIKTINRRGGEYTLLLQDGIPRAGIMARPNDDVRPVWLTHFGVSDPAAAALQAESLGGRILVAPSPEFRDGTIAVVTDPSGAILVLSKTSS
jgi:predicted enzyme related to lactoylglutathione lyase